MQLSAMAKAERLIQLMQHLRTLVPPILADRLAADLGVSVRTIYRDIDSLRAAGAIIDGEAGFGYTIIEDPALPPMLFSRDEMEALVLGLKEVREVGDPILAAAATNALAKLKACLPERMRLQFEHAVLTAKRFHQRPTITIDIAALRSAAREEKAIDVIYVDEREQRTVRRLLPLSIVFMDQVLVLLAWCKLRDDFRSFRIDRISDLNLCNESFRPRRVPLLRNYLVRLKNELENERSV